MTTDRQPFEIVLRLGVEANNYDTARAVARTIVEKIEEGMVAVGPQLHKIEFRNLSVQRRQGIRL